VRALAGPSLQAADDDDERRALITSPTPGERAGRRIGERAFLAFKLPSLHSGAWSCLPQRCRDAGQGGSRLAASAF